MIQGGFEVCLIKALSRDLEFWTHSKNSNRRGKNIELIQIVFHTLQHVESSI
jgi:hypothetical protein